jgi:pimeloyl-ACP methyl ester carboxylesterase
MPVQLAAETVALNGVELHYSARGTGEPLLLLHGFGSCAADWGSLADKLASKHRVITIDARGHGRSTNPSGKFSHAQAADDLRALMDHLGIKQARALGFSSGGMTLLQLATRHPDRVSRMVVVGATTHFPEHAREILKSATMEQLPQQVLAGFRQCASRGEEQVRSLVGQFRALGSSRDDMNLRRPDLARIKAKTLIVHGDRDMFFPVSIPATLYQSISGSALWIVPNGDHSPTAGADEAAFVHEVGSFLQK